MASGLTYHPRLYLGESIKVEKLDKIKKRLEKKPLLSRVFLLSLSRNTFDQLEIYEARQLSQSYYRRNPPFIVGIAGDWEEAVSLVEKIAKECLQARGDCALKEYLRC